MDRYTKSAKSASAIRTFVGKEEKEVSADFRCSFVVILVLFTESLIISVVGASTALSIPVLTTACNPLRRTGVDVMEALSGMTSEDISVDSVQHVSSRIRSPQKCAQRVAEGFVNGYLSLVMVEGVRHVQRHVKDSMPTTDPWVLLGRRSIGRNVGLQCHLQGVTGPCHSRGWRVRGVRWLTSGCLPKAGCWAGVLSEDCTAGWLEGPLRQGRNAGSDLKRSNVLVRNNGV